MASGSGWILYCSSSIEIIIISILFIVLYITVHTLCINCFGSQSPKSPEHSDVKEIHSIPPKEKPEDQLNTNGTSGSEHAQNHVLQNSVQQVPVKLHQNRSHTMVHHHTPKVYIHNRAESHGYFSQGMMMPNLTTTPVYTVGSADSVLPRIPDLPPLPPNHPQPKIQVKWSPSLQHNKTVTNDPGESDRCDRINSNNMFTDHIYSGTELEVSEENPYESIGLVRFSEPTLPPCCDEASEEQCESQSPYRVVKEPVKPTASHSSTSLTEITSGQAEGSGLVSPILPVTQDGQPLIDSKSTAIYAAVNRKNKSLKCQEFPLSPITKQLTENDITEDAAPPVPQKMFV